MSSTDINILYIHTHDSGRYLNPGESPRQLPHIGSLAENGVSFRNAFSAAPTCSPSRSALLTGMPPHANGMVGLAHRGFRLHDYSDHLRADFSAAGFETVLCGIQHVAPDPETIGYDRVLHGPEMEEHADARSWDRGNADRVAAYLRQPHERPFFLSFGMFTTHRPFPEASGDQAARNYPPPPPGVPDTAETRGDMEGFVGGLETVDEAVGTVLEALSDAGLWERSVVILTTDHGPAFPEMKGTLADAGIGVSLIVRIPGLAEDGRVEEALISQIDLHPTLLELCGRNPSPRSGATGRSLLPLLRGETAHIREYLFAETNYHAVYEPARAVRSDRYKLIRRYGRQTAPKPANVDDSPGKDVLAVAGYFERPKPREVLFDLCLDPLERTNLAAESAYHQVHEHLAGVLDDWMQQSGDVLYLGPIPRREGTIMNRDDAWSAEEPTTEEPNNGRAPQ